MCCITGGWATSLVLLGWAFHVLLWTESHGDDLFPPPQWLCLPRWRWLRLVLATLAGLCFLALAVPFALAFVPAAFKFRALSLGIVGVVMMAWGLLRLLDPPGAPAEGSLQWLLPVRGRWAPAFLVAVGAMIVAIACLVGQ